MLDHCRKAEKKQGDAARKEKAAEKAQKKQERKLKQSQLGFLGSVTGKVTAPFESKQQQSAQPHTVQQAGCAKGAGTSRGTKLAMVLLLLRHTSTPLTQFAQSIIL